MQPQREQFESLLQPVLSSAYGTAYRLIGNREAAMDLVQDAVVQAYKAFHTFEPGTNFKAWLLRILTNRFFKQRSREQAHARTVTLEDAEDFYLFASMDASHAGGMQSGTPDPVDSLFDSLDNEAIQNAMDELPDEFRVVCSLFFMNDMRYDEIAALLDIPIGTVRSRLHRGRRHLQKALWSIAESRGIVKQSDITEAETN